MSLGKPLCNVFARRPYGFFHDLFAYYFGGGAGQSDPDLTPLYKGEIPERIRLREMRGWKGIWHCRKVI